MNAHSPQIASPKTRRVKHTCVRVTPKTHRQILKIATDHGMTVLGAASMLVRAWASLTPEARAKVIAGGGP